MNLTSYEVVKRAVEFGSPARVGLRFPSLGVSDIFRIFPQKPRRQRLVNDALPDMTKKVRPASGDMDEWGCWWETVAGAVGEDMGQVTVHPLADWECFASFPFPDPMAEGRFDGLAEVLAVSKDRYVQLNSPFCLFERMHFMRGLDRLMLDLIEQPGEVERLADQVIAYQVGMVEQAAALGKGRIHCFDTTDDWGTQTGLMINPKVWRAIFKPRYYHLAEAIHRAGMHFRFHIDGKVNSILMDLVEIGVDIINIHQPRLVGIEEVGRLLRGKICFEAAVDIQSTLPGGDRAKIEDEVRLLVEHWATPKGGLIGVEYRDLKAIGATRQSLAWALEAFQKFGNL